MTAPRHKAKRKGAAARRPKPREVPSTSKHHELSRPPRRARCAAEEAAAGHEARYEIPRQTWTWGGIVGYFDRRAETSKFARDLVQQYHYVSGIKEALGDRPN